MSAEDIIINTQEVLAATLGLLPTKVLNKLIREAKGALEDSKLQSTPFDGLARSYELYVLGVTTRTASAVAKRRGLAFVSFLACTMQ